MKSRFKLPILLLLITSLVASAQQIEIYKNSFDATNLSTLELDLNSTSINVQKSEDDKVHFNYSINFNNYSKKETQEIINKIEVSAEIEKGKLVLKSDSQSTRGDVVYSVETLFGITFEGNNVTFKEPSTRKFRKGRQYFMSINDGSRIKSIKEYIKNIKAFDSKKKKKKIKMKNIKSYRTNFIIKIPKNLNLRATVINSNMTFNMDIASQMILNARNSKLQFQSMSNNLNNFDVVNGEFRASILQGGTYKFNHVSKVLLAKINNVNMDSEFADFRIGEIGKNVKIFDFNSIFWLHNFAVDFDEFTMNTEYSEINLFLPEKIEYNIQTFGHNTVHYWDNIITEIQPSRKNKSSKMMVIGEETAPNKIKINSVHGIVRFGKDFIDFGE
ncbi:hypothetical protein [uncultured Winogradskyella sp.]|uniref:hypothetical protein n=1 Tax=uncultured Winogradskyella sp. TaxID=395353 RepID=UPI0026376481|nr:hypothetical protein [uncultured Winogradskyella sp.]